MFHIQDTSVYKLCPFESSDQFEIKYTLEKCSNLSCNIILLNDLTFLFALQHAKHNKTE